jgi:hypothetical protein
MNLRGEGKMPSRLPAGRRRYSMPLPEARRMSEARRIDKGVGDRLVWLLFRDP